MTPRSHELARAAHACVVAVKGRKDPAFEKKYGALAHKLPVLVLQNGLAQATGFLLAKAGDVPSGNGPVRSEHRALLTDLAQVLTRTGEPMCGSADQLHQTIIQADVVSTMRLTRRVLDASAWLKRYVQGVLNVTATGDAAEPAAGPGSEGGRR